ncbi:5'-methylthioadenosine/S-adenosylhomocysteine nucleosidase [Salicibibacter cibarius]|uniref:5'-methylthioadenosine/S-adenosylhomocysteine nucleosidase n=1 Tax=Salicibibacter cibarius TaxID=2743000 RepID=A0A7T7CBA8_9BACI|nr:5'-methylthioadenosine/S-adenosylhomocysteine nucleosidase [Salicibibacter cibarius]QQK75695.1 5'-methylthioadenosine/S-adenosylhomocysteine nucleosidase [Salicibibacter cibarius]
MKYGIIGAMEEEVEILATQMKHATTTEKGGCVFYEGQLNGHEVVLMQSGIGKVNAAIGTTLLIDTYNPDIVINTGVAGGFDMEMAIGDLVISTYVSYNDVDATAFGYTFGQVPGMPSEYYAKKDLVEYANAAALQTGANATSGLILSGDSFMSDEKRVADLRAEFPDAKCSEMEAGAIAQVCYRFQIPFVIIRALSDIVGKDALESYETFLDKAANQSADVVQIFMDETNAYR